jgi:hypothetical protein
MLVEAPVCCSICTSVCLNLSSSVTTVATKKVGGQAKRPIDKNRKSKGFQRAKPFGGERGRAPQSFSNS